MKCQRCGKDLGDATKCNFCGFENSEGNVREMSRAEKNFYNGVTIDLSDPENNFRSKNYNRTYTNFGGSNIGYGFIEKILRALLQGNLLAKILVAMIFIAVSALLFFIAVPLMIFLISAIVVFLLYAKIVRRL